MLTKTIKYTDFNGEEQEEEFYFHISKGEFVELEFSEADGFSEYLEKITSENDVPKIFATFKQIILLAYGQKSPDGRRFIKSEALRNEFLSSAAYSELITEIATDTDAAAAFVAGCLPADLQKEVEALTAAQTPEPASDPEAQE